MNYGKDRMELYPTQFVADTRRDISMLVSDGSERSTGDLVFSRVEFKDKTHHQVISDCALVLCGNAETQEEARQTGQEILDHCKIEGHLEVYSFQKPAMATLGFYPNGIPEGIPTKTCWNCKIHISEETFFQLVPMLSNAERVQGIIEKANKKLNEIQSSMDRVSEYFGLPVHGVVIDYQREKTWVEFSPLNETTSLEGVQLNVVDKITMPGTLKSELFDAFKQTLADNYGFRKNRISKHGNEEVVDHFCLTGKENIETLTNILDGSQPSPQADQQMTPESWQELLQQKRDKVLEEAKAQFLEETKTGSESSRKNVSPSKASTELSEEYQQIFNNMMEEIKRGEYGS